MWLQFHQIGLAVESLSIKKCTQESGPNADDFNVAGIREKNVNLSHISKKKVYINQEDCEGCGSCKAACPAGAIFYNENGLAEVDHEKCLTCGYCSPVCPVRAVIMY